MNAYPGRVAYVATLNLPDNPRAHAIQVMKNAQAWARAVGDFEMITNLGWSDRRRLNPAAVQAYYGLSTPFPIIALPLRSWEERSTPWIREMYYRLAAWRCRLRRVDLIFTRSYRGAAHFLRQGIPTLVESHAPPEETADKTALYQSLDHPLLLGLVTISEPLAERYRAFGLPAAKILVLPDGVDLEQFSRPESPQAAREALGLPVATPLAVYTGHLYPGRGITSILSAAARLPQVHFLLVGGYPADLARRQEQIRAMQLTNITLTGFVANRLLPRYLWAADLLLMPYTPRCPTAEWMSPLKMFEYMAAGRPIIATDLPALKTVLRHGVNALLVPPDADAAMAMAVEALLADPATALRLSEQAASDVIPYSWDRRIARMIDWARQAR